MKAHKILTREFNLSFFAQFTLSFSFFILMTTLPVYLSKLKARESEIGILIGALTFSSLLIRPLIGKALMKNPETRFMAIGSLLFALTSLAYLLAKPFWPFLIVRILQGLGWALFATSVFTLITRISPEAHRGQSLGYFYLAINIAFALAPSLGIYLIIHTNFTLLFLVCVGLSISSFWISMKLGKTKKLSLTHLPNQSSSFFHRKSLPIALMALMGSFIWGAVTTFFPLYALSQGISNPGLFFGTVALTLIISRSLGGKIFDLYPRDRVIFPCIVAHIIAMIILAFSSTLAFILLVALIWGLGIAFFYPTLVAYTTDLAGESRGPAMGTYLAFSDFGSSIGSVVMGFVLQRTSYRIMFLSSALVGVINLFYFYIAIFKKGKTEIERR
ncbi:MAG: MFS transporter [Thermodesulfobacteriota bacterium]